MAFTFSSDNGSSGNPPINNSLRFRSAASAYLSATLAGAGNSRRWSLSAWVKRGTLGAAQTILSSGATGTTYSEVGFNSADKLYYTSFNASDKGAVATTAVFRDPSSWYHILINVDTNAFASPGIKIYVNGVEQALTTTTSLNNNGADHFINTAIAHSIGRKHPTTNQYLDEYVARLCFIDNGSKVPADFGYTDATTGQWVSKSAGACKAVVDAGGTNSFMLEFDGGTAGTIGNDYSSKNNDWASTGHYFTDATNVQYDWMTDTPTNNYALLNPLNTGGTAGTVMSFGNLYYYYANTSAWITAGSTLSVSSGKWYWEVVCTNLVAANSDAVIGIGKSTDYYGGVNYYTGQGTNNYGYYDLNGNKYNNGTATAYGASYTDNDVIGVALDLTAGTLTFYKNNVSQGVAFSSLSGEFMPTVSSKSGVLYPNFGQRPFRYTPPTGFKALCTANLPVPTIRNPRKHFEAKTYAGNGTSQNVQTIQFQPDLVWLKGRSGATNHNLVDSVRGTLSTLFSSTTGAENTSNQRVTAFNSDGFTVGNDTDVNTNTASYVSWLWKANGAAVTNTSGTITSQVSANTTAGFSIVTFNAGASGIKTVGHGLNVAPKLIISKDRVGGSGSWLTWHSILTSNEYLLLNTTAAKVTLSNVWGSAIPTSSVFGFNSGSTYVANNDVVAYCFAEVAGYSKIGSYTGNGSADGPFVYCGFKPRYVLVKCSSTTGAWELFDTARDQFNVSNRLLEPNSSGAEQQAANYDIDINANGFKLRGTGASINSNTATYIFMAFAEAPFNYSTGR